ncbi:MAG: ATP-binding protein [Thermoanaerobaculia bacterium]
MRLPIRVYLTAWYSIVLLATLVLFSGLAYLFIGRHLRTLAEASIRGTMISFQSAVIAEEAEEPGDSRVKVLREVAADFRFSGFQIVVFDAHGRPIASSGNRDGLPVGIDPEILNLGRGPAVLRHLHGDGARERRVLVGRTTFGPSSYATVIVGSLAAERRLLELLRTAYLVGIPLALLLSAVGGYLLARRGMTPVASITKTAERISARNLDERLEGEEGSDELAALVRVLNALLSRLQIAFEQQKSFLADASHELRTPMTIIQGEAGVALSRERSASEYREALEIVHAEATNLMHVVENLFLLARGDAKRYPLERRAVDAAELLRESLHSLRSRAGSRDVSLHLQCDPALALSGDEDLLRRMLVNLLDNAIRHTRGGGVVSVEASRKGADVRISIRDQGPGIPSSAQPHLFERFYRVRQNPPGVEQGGGGLGLSIVRWIAELHGGRALLESTGAEGSTFVVLLPAGDDSPENRTGEPPSATTPSIATSRC